jgi:hypothetical protein
MIATLILGTLLAGALAGLLFLWVEFKFVKEELEYACKGREEWYRAYKRCQTEKWELEAELVTFKSKKKAKK